MALTAIGVKLRKWILAHQPTVFRNDALVFANGNEKGNGKGPTLKSLNRSIVALATKFDKFNLPNDDDDDDDESSEEEEGTSNHSNAALTHQSKKKKRGGN
jgi:hypothetical protein